MMFVYVRVWPSWKSGILLIDWFMVPQSDVGSSEGTDLHLLVCAHCSVCFSVCICGFLHLKTFLHSIWMVGHHDFSIDIDMCIHAWVKGRKDVLQSEHYSCPSPKHTPVDADSPTHRQRVYQGSQGTCESRELCFTFQFHNPPSSE